MDTSMSYEPSTLMKYIIFPPGCLAYSNVSVGPYTPTACNVHIILRVYPANS